MRAGLVASIIGHVGAVLMTMLAWEARSTITSSRGAVVPVEIVAIAPESNVRALAIPNIAEDTPEASEETQQAEPQPTSAPAPPRQRPTPQTQDDFDLDAIARLVDKQKQPGQRRTEGAAADRNQQAAGAGTGGSVAAQDRARAIMRAHLRRCWRMPADLPDPERLIVTIEFELNRNGTLNGQPRVTNPRNYTFDPAMRTAAEAALRAVRQCDPYPLPEDPLVGSDYQVWREQQLVFSVNF